MLYYLSELQGVFNVLQYVTFRGMGAALTSLLITLWLGSDIIRMLVRLKLGQPIRGKDVVRDLAELHGSKKGTPTMGGLMIVLSVILSCLLWGVISNTYLQLVLFSMLMFALLGFIDDYKKITKKHHGGITSKQKLAGQVIIALFVGAVLMWNEQTREAAFYVDIPFLKNTAIYLGWFVVLFFIVVIVGCSNAVNLTDGLDGLATGCTISVSGVYTIFAYLVSNKTTATYLLLTRTPGAEELAVFCAALMGACMGFLWFNCHPAKVFMGDTGALAIGGSLGVVAVCINQELLLAIVGGVFVMEALSVIIQVVSFKTTGKRVFAMSPLHHHFELKGWSETTVVVRFWILSVVFSVIGLCSLKLR